jgi:NAD-dependent oxidoreductase involved in siderophore biosynthesis
VVVRRIAETDNRRIDAIRRFYVTPAPMALLSSGVPLSLLLDLALGPNSEDLLTHEHLADIRDSYE